MNTWKRSAGRSFVQKCGVFAAALSLFILIGLCGCSSVSSQQDESTNNKDSSVQNEPGQSSSGGSSSDIYLDTVSKEALLKMIDGQISGCDIFIDMYSSGTESQDTGEKYKTRKGLLEDLMGQVEMMDESDNESLVYAYEEMHKILGQ
jgi:hypothetical protein